MLSTVADKAENVCGKDQEFCSDLTQAQILIRLWRYQRNRIGFNLEVTGLDERWMTGEFLHVCV